MVIGYLALLSSGSTRCGTMDSTEIEIRSLSTRRLPRPFIFLLAGVAVAAAAFLIPYLLIPDGVDRFRDDRMKYVVAATAYDVAWLLNDKPLSFVLFPAARVTNVEHEPGSCLMGEPGSDSSYAPYTARVRFHTWFGFPGPSVVVTCGGWRWMWSSLAR